MCLLIKQPATTNFHDEWIADFYQRNQDGIGIMYAQAGLLHYVKELPRNAEEAVKFYRKHAEGRDCFIHFRMQTHGDVDLTNCHPYPVQGFEEFGPEEDPLLLMHNGILSSGNDADTSKSDTWHYIRDYLRPILAGRTDVAFTPAFIKMVGGHIGSNNKFALMDSEGRMAIVNESAGVQFQGAWLSNTYAWSYARSGLMTNYYRFPRKGETTTARTGTGGAKTWSGQDAWRNAYIGRDDYDDLDDYFGYEGGPSDTAELELDLKGSAMPKAKAPALPAPKDAKLTPRRAGKNARKEGKKQVEVLKQAVKDTLIESPAQRAKRALPKVRSRSYRTEAIEAMNAFSLATPRVFREVTQGELETLFEKLGESLAWYLIEDFTHTGGLSDSEFLTLLRNPEKAGLVAQTMRRAEREQVWRNGKEPAAEQPVATTSPGV
jgi:hypothetical protein